MNISQLGTRITDFARTALTAAKQRNQKPEPSEARRPSVPWGQTRNQKPSSPPLASILRPQARERWLLPQVGAITPQYIEMTLRGALAGAHLPQWELFNLMEDTWPRLRKNLLELKMAVRNRRPVFEAYRDEDMEESPTATERMKLVSAALRHMQPDPTADEGGFDDMLFDILDAWFKGVSVLEIDWHVTQTHSLGRFIAPRCTRWANPIHYAWDTDLRLGLNVANANTNAVAAVYDRRTPNRENATVTDRRYNNEGALASFPADRFIVAKCKTKSGSILGGALLRPLAWWWCAANFSADWLLNLAQIFGLPFRWATYEPTAAQETVDRICAMLQNMGSAGWAAFPAGTSLELKADGQKSGAQTPQGDMLNRADKQCDLLVLGQTLTTDTGGMGSGGGSHALGQVHADVRSGIIDAAAKFTAGVLEQQLIPAILRLNYGDTTEAPTLTLQERTEDNLHEKAAILTQLHAAGAGSIIPLDWLGKTFGIPKPKAGEATLAGQNATIPTQLHPGAPVAAAEHWDPNLHPRDDTNGQFTFSQNGSERSHESPSNDSAAIAPKKQVAPRVRRLTFEQERSHTLGLGEDVPVHSDPPPPIPDSNPNAIVVPKNVRVITLYNSKAIGDADETATGLMFKKAALEHATYKELAIDVSIAGWQSEYIKALSYYSYGPIWVYVYDHGGHANQQLGRDVISADSKAVWDFLTSSKSVKLVHLFGCNTGAQYYGDPARRFNDVAIEKGITIRMSRTRYIYQTNPRNSPFPPPKYYPSTAGPIRAFPEPEPKPPEK